MCFKDGCRSALHFEKFSAVSEACVLLLCFGVCSVSAVAPVQWPRAPYPSVVPLWQCPACMPVAGPSGWLQLKTPGPEASLAAWSSSTRSRLTNASDAAHCAWNAQCKGRSSGSSLDLWVQSARFAQVPPPASPLAAQFSPAWSRDLEPATRLTSKELRLVVAMQRVCTCRRCWTVLCSRVSTLSRSSTRARSLRAATSVVGPLRRSQH